MTKVLVEDDPLNLELVCEILRANGFTVHEASSGKGNRERLIEAGFNDYVPKPIDVADFMKIVEKYRK
jgi:CheY-like chemotaxis protein